MIDLEFLTDYKKKSGQRKFRNKPIERIKIYDKIRALISNSMTINDIITKLLARKKPTDFEADTCFLRHVQESFNKGSSFSEALRGWAEPGEIMLIKAGEETGRISDSMGRCIRLMDQMIVMRKTVVSNMIYPAILFIALFGIIVGFAKGMVPILLSFSESNTWPGYAETLYYITTWISDNIIIVLGLIFGAITIVTKSLPIWCGSKRQKFDSYPPYSMYRDIQSGLLLISIATLMKSGIPFRRSLENLKAEAQPYVAEKINEIIDNIDTGMNNGEAINIDFVGEIGDDIEDYSSGASIDEAMDKLGDRSIKEKLEKITKASTLIRGIAIIFVMLFVVWSYLSFIGITMGMELGN
jgi:type II secretory pathway component PulF